MKNNVISSIKRKILESKHIAITSHLRPDGDSICTSLALYFIGKSLGKEVEIINKDKTPFPLNNFPDADKIKIGQIPVERFDVVILLECANVSRSGQENLNEYFKINIDHHQSNDYYANINWVNADSSAVGCMAYDLAKELNVKFTPKIANYLYTAIVSDTGSFQFSNTKAYSFKVCYDLVRHGASPIEISEFLFNNNPPEKIKLLGQVLSTLQVNEGGNIAIITMFKSHLDSLNIREINTEDISTLARSIKGVQMVLFFKEIDRNKFRISLRSKGEFNSALIAEHFGGGGHPYAAAFTVEGEYKKLKKEIPEEILNFLKKPGKSIYQ